MKKVIVVGSISIDNTIFTSSLPGAGTTVSANSYMTNIGGKGANQACACHFLGGDVVFIGSIGKDNNGNTVKEFLKAQGLKCHLKESNEPTGVAFIMLEETSGENRILIVQGSNKDLHKEDIDKYDDLFNEGDILLTQFENNPEVVQYIVKKAHEKKMTVIVNPAPVNKFDENYYQYVDFLIPNEHEIEQLTGIIDRNKACHYLLDKGVKNVVVTLGDKGSMLVNKDGVTNVAPHKVVAVDTTAAGDSFLGAFSYKLSTGAPVIEALNFASLASSFTVTKKGAIIALPHADDLKSIS